MSSDMSDSLSPSHISSPSNDSLNAPTPTHGSSASMSASDSQAAAQAQAAIDAQLVDSLTTYLRHACPPLLHAHIPAFVAALNTLETHEALTAFVSDTATFTLVIHRVISKAAHTTSTAAAAAGDSTESFLFSTQPPSSFPAAVLSTITSSLSVIKQSASLDASVPLAQQLYVCTLHSPAMFDTLLSYVRHLFLPFSRTLTLPPSDGAQPASDASTAGQSSAASGDAGLYKNVSRKLGELEVELLRFQEHVDIPFITLDLHPLIAAYLSKEGKAVSSATSVALSSLPFDASDASLLNDIQQRLNEWKKNILRVTRLTRDVNSGTVSQEVSFWLAMERAVTHIYEQKESVGVELTFQLLKQNKRFLATTGFMQDVGMSEEGRDKDRVVRYAQFLRDLPIKRLLSATDLQEVNRALDAVFHHLKQIKRVDYPLARVVALLHALSRDAVTQVQSILSSRHVMTVGRDEFLQLMAPVEELWRSWTERVTELSDIVKSIARKKPSENISRLSDKYGEWTDMATRLLDIRRLRKEHEELRSVIADTLSNDTYVRLSALDALHSAYSFLTRDIDPLSITAEGKDAFAAAVVLYNQRVDRVESELELKIRELLDAAKDDSIEMFRVCARFNPLFVRPRIAAAIREYQEQLIATVKKDIACLQRQWHDKAAKGEARVMSAMHDLPPLSASLTWSRQIERQLDMYVARVEQVLGRQWHHHIDGKQLKRDSDDFRLKLKPAKLFSAWLADTQQQLGQLQVKGAIYRVLTLGSAAAVGGGRAVLAVNFDRRLVVLFKEVKALQRLELKMPFDIITAADEARQNYPFAMRLEETLRIYTRTCNRLEGKEQLALLAAGLRRGMQESIGKGVQLQWLDSGVKGYVDALAGQAVEFADQVEEVSEWVDKAEALLERVRLAKVEEAAGVKGWLAELQAVVDHLDKRGYSNLDEYVQWVDQQVEAAVVRRLRLLIDAFVSAVSWNGKQSSESREREERERREKMQLDEEEDEQSQQQQQQQRKLAPSSQLAELIFPSPIKHELLIRNQMLIVEPPLERARLSLVRSFHSWLSQLLELPRIRLDSPTALSSATLTSTATYRSCVNTLEPAVLSGVLSAIEAQLSSASHYVDSWLQYQALWDLDVDGVVADMGGSLALWERLLIDIKRARATFDTNDSARHFGPLHIEYSAVQQRVNNKYDSWHKTLTNRFGALLQERTTQLYTALRQARELLEKHTFDFGSTADIVDSVTMLQSLRVKADGWREDVTRMASVEQLLQRQRYHFPSDWLFSERVEGEWRAFEQILARKLQRMQEEAPAIQQKIGYEDVELDRRIKEYQAEWKKNRPTKGDAHHKQVEALLNVSDVQLSKLEHDVERVTLAKRALSMDVREEVRLHPIREELAGLKEVWGYLSASWRELDELQDRYFRDVKPSDIRKSLTRLQTDVSRLPNAMRSYEAFEYLRSTIKAYLGMNAQLVELHSGVLRPKHEKAILKELRINSAWSELTVGQLWATDLKAHQKALQAILTAAQGESALEEFLNEVREQWETTRFELVDYRGKCLLVRNWDSLFSQLADRLSDLSGMKQSPFFKSFERDALSWEAKMNAAQGILDVLIDVQRKWVYLEAIFSNSTDVQSQLATQYKKFKAFDRDYTRLMRDIAKDPLLDTWAKDERRLQAELDSYAETLSLIQKALGEYLEKQRAAFPRFYFVGDEDLLEMIGNAKTPAKIARHLSKMFAGLEGLHVVEEEGGGKRVLGMTSKEGEEVAFARAVEVDEGSVHAWLREVEYQMRYTLAVLLERSIGEMSALDAQRSEKGNTPAYVDAFFSWIDRYPAQIVLLSQQVQFSIAVDSALSSTSSVPSALSGVLTRVENALDLLADRILLPTLTPDCRKKYEQLITEKVHQRDAVRALAAAKVSSAASFEWVQQMRYYFTPYTGKLDPSHAATPELSTLSVRIGRASFAYGFEYLGVSERLVQTPLTDIAYFTLCEALHMRLGGNPFGPAGTGQ